MATSNNHDDYLMLDSSNIWADKSIAASSPLEEEAVIGLLQESPHESELAFGTAIAIPFTFTTPGTQAQLNLQDNDKVINSYIMFFLHLHIRCFSEYSSYP